MTLVSSSYPRAVTRWRSFESWVGTRGSAIALFVLALVVFAVQSAVLPAFQGRDMNRFVQTYVQLPYDDAILPSVMNSRGPLAALGVGLPLELGGVAAEIWLALLYAASIVAWGAVALMFGKRAAILTAGLLLVYPGYGILFHGLASDSLFAAAFAGWSYLLTRAMLRPSVAGFLAAGIGMGVLALVRPSNQVLIAVALVPLLLRDRPWGHRLRWVGSFFVGSAVVTQGWKAIAELRYGDVVGLKPSTGVLALAALIGLALVLPASWRRPAALLGVLSLIAIVVVSGADFRSPTEYARTVAQIPGGNPFLYRAFMLSAILSPDNGPASKELGKVVQRELLAEEPYRSYGVNLDQFFSERSDRMFEDLASLGGSADLEEATDEAIRAHPATFATGIARTMWQMLWTRRVYAPEPAPGGSSGPTPDEGTAAAGGSTVVVNGLTLPRPSEDQPIPGARIGPGINTLWAPARQVWRSGTERVLVFEDPRDEQRWETFQRDTDRLAARIPTREASQDIVHRLNQTSHVFPAPVFWAVVGLVGLALRRPRNALVALVPAMAGLVVVAATALIATAVGEYIAPVSPAFVLLAAVGLLGRDSRPLRIPWRR